MSPWHAQEAALRLWREKAENAERALGLIADCADWCEDCEPTERKLATHTTHHAGIPMFLCDEHAEEMRVACHKAESKGCGRQPEVEPHEQEVETTIALKALGLWPTGRSGHSVSDGGSKQ